MTRLDAHTATTFQRLKAPEFDAIRSYLDAVYLDALTRMSTVGDEAMWRRLQGRAELANDLLQLVESSGELAAKLSRPQR